MATILASGFMKNLPLYAGIAAGVILLVAFIVGAVKGVRRVSWGAFYWAVAAVGFIFAYTFLIDKNPLEKILTGHLLDGAKRFWTVGLALACILLSLLVYGLFSAILRPREVWVRDNDNCYDGFHYDIDYDDDTTFKGGLGQELTVRKYKSGVFGRFFGGLLCVFNVAFVLAVIAAVGILIIQSTGLRNLKISLLVTKGFMGKITPYLLSYGLDFLTIGILFGMAYKGFQVGFIGSASAVIKTLGVLGVIGLAFATPFVGKLANLPYIHGIIGKCIGIWTNAVPSFANVLGKLTAGALFALVGAIVVLLVGFILGKITDKIADIKVIRALDGMLSAVVFLVIGLAICVVAWELLYVLDHFDIFNVRLIFNDKSALTVELYETGEEIFDWIAPKIKGLLAKLPV